MALSKASKFTFAIAFGAAWCVCIIIGATLVGLAQSDVLNGTYYFPTNLEAGFIVGGIFLFLGFVFFVTDVIYWILWMKDNTPTVQRTQYAGVPPAPFCAYCGQQKLHPGPCALCKN